MREIKNLDALELSEALLDTYKCVHGFGFNGHFISLMPTKHYYYLAYKHRDSLDAYSGLFGQYFREYPDNKTGYIRTPCHVL